MAKEKRDGQASAFTSENGDWNCSRCGDQCDCPNTENIIKALASDIRVAHNREITAKDAEISSLCKLISKLVDALEKIDNMYDGDMCKFFTSTKSCSRCKYLKVCGTGVAHSTLIKHKSEIKKAQKVANG